MTDFSYVGTELELFSEVRNWKTYWSGQLQPYVTGDVLEVGAGIGSNTRYLDRGGAGRWVCLEPDSGLAAQLTEGLGQIRHLRPHEMVCGTLSSLEQRQRFDTIVYVDVLEHIEDDRGELEKAASLLRPGGRVIVLSPAHQSLFSPFDAAIGHFRRYDRAMLRRITPLGLELERLIYLDSCGLVLSSANRLLLRQSMPSRAQLQFWDRWVIPLSRIFDGCFAHLVGKSIVGVWRRKEAESE